MTMQKNFIRLGLVMVAIVTGVLMSLPQRLVAHDDASTSNATCEPTDYCPTQLGNVLSPQLDAFVAPSITAPAPPAPPARPITRTVTYDATTRGNITADFAAFKSLANQTLNDTRGWSRLGVKFVEVASGGQFTLVLSEASQVPSFAAGCDSTYSCNVGRYVIINQDRWQGATASWNQAGGSLRDYRHMVVNHETGHWLGHGHAGCPAAGQPAPLMQQQSIGLQGCTFNPWPLASELRSSRLGL